MKSQHQIWQTMAIVAALLTVPVRLGATSFDESDVETEQCLAEGKLLKKQKTLEGVTRPELYLIECDGDKRKALIKRLDEERRGKTQFGDGRWEMNFTDRFSYERAAYLLDRELGMNMVPVAVVRKVGRNNAGVVEWIENASHVDTSPHQPRVRLSSAC